MTINHASNPSLNYLWMGGRIVGGKVWKIRNLEEVTECITLEEEIEQEQQDQMPASVMDYMAGGFRGHDAA